MPIFFLALGIGVVYTIDVLFFQEDRIELLKTNCISYPDNCDNVLIEPSYFTFVVPLVFLIFGILVMNAMRQLG